MFNEYMWQTYLKAEGKEIVDFFKKNIENEMTEKYAEKICEFHKGYCPSSYINKDIESQLKQIEEDIKNGEIFFPCYYVLNNTQEKEYNIFELIEMLAIGIDNEDNLTEKQIFEDFVCNLTYYTTFLFGLFPEIAVPYYFQCNYNVLEKIASEFEINLPDIPIKKDYIGRFVYYAELCDSLYQFREKNSLSPYELCAFLYDFAPKFIGGIDSYIIKDLPPAKSAYFIGGTKDDLFLSDETNVITPWQCNPETLAGDNIVMYLKTPVSAIDSIWRSVSIGFNDPFFFHYRCTYISQQTKINKISLTQLQEDNVFKELPIVRKNMQGVNGVEIYPSVYNHILEITKTNLQKLEFTITDDKINLKREKDVENILVKPFLKDLGYDVNDYVQQLHIEVGNHNYKLIPDFVIKPVISKGHNFAEFLIEAKYSVKSQKELEEYKKQARSYANQLNVKYSIIASKEGIWVSSKTDDFSRDFLVFSWAELKNNDNFYRVAKFLGKGNVIKSAETRKKLSGRATEYLMFTEE